MITVHLSWFEDICNRVNEALQGGIFQWISNWFSYGMDWLSNKWNEVIYSALQKFAQTLLNGILEFIFARFYAVLTTILMILDCIEDCFDIVSGISPVYRVTDGQYKPMTLLTALYSEPAVQKMIAAMIGIGMVLCMLCAILATIKSMMEMDGRQTKPVGHVMRTTAKAMLYFILVPLIAGFMLTLSGAILNTIDNSFAQGKGKTTVARSIFAIASLDAVDTEKHPDGLAYNSSYEGEKAADFGVMDKFRKEFFLVDEESLLPAYANPIRVKETFTFRGIDYIVGFGMGIYFNIVLGMVLFIFICRIFEVIVLLITEPFFIAMMPLDDGEHFKSWSSLFIGKLFGGYGMVVAMRLYLWIAAMLFSNTISFVRPESTGATVQNYLIKLLFLAGGAMGIRSVGPLVTSILSQSAARAEQEEAAMGARYGGFIASFQGRRMGKLLKSTGNMAGEVASAGAAAAIYGGERAVGAAVGGVQKLFRGRSHSSSDKGGKNNGNQYNGGVPQAQAQAEVNTERRVNDQILEVRNLAGAGDNTGQRGGENTGQRGGENKVNNVLQAGNIGNIAAGDNNNKGHGKGMNEILGVGDGNIAGDGNLLNDRNNGGNAFNGNRDK